MLFWYNYPRRLGMNRKRIYPSLAKWRDDQRLSQEEAAARLQVSQPYYSRLERGLQFPKRTLARQIADRTGVPLESVLGLD